MKKLDIKGIFTRPRKLLLHPETEWQVIGRENIEGIELFKNFLVPLSVLSSACAILLRLLSTSPLYAIGTGIILFMASVVGSYIAYRVSREYLSNKWLQPTGWPFALPCTARPSSSRSTAFPVDSRKDLYPNSWQYVACCACVPFTSG